MEIKVIKPHMFARQIRKRINKLLEKKINKHEGGGGMFVIIEILSLA